MSSIANDLKAINSVVYKNLHDILKKLNKQYRIKIYSVLLREADFSHVDTLRVKKTISENGCGGYGVTSKNIQNLDNMFMELQIENVFGNDTEKFQAEIANVLNRNEVKAIGSLKKQDLRMSQEECEEGVKSEGNSIASRMAENRVLYANRFRLSNNGNNYTAVYVMEVQNVDEETMGLFYFKPVFSFLRMLLDYFFVDFFTLNEDEVLKLNDQGDLDKRYYEDDTQFTRRMSRAFFGKIHHFIPKVYSASEEKEFLNQVDLVYYMSDLQENIDDIATKTYENSSPFGSILFCNRDAILDASKQRINFTIKFMEEDRIKLEDSTRIRKLLQLTDENQELHLIADHQYIYGIGEVDWGKMNDVIALRLTFNGLSKYDLSIVRLNQTLENGMLLSKGDSKIYQFSMRLISERLLSISFKNPKIGEDNYSSNKLRTLLRSEFEDEWHDSMEDLEHIIQKAREQKHGTMVVITNKETAEKELKTLKKQSTQIEPKKIKPEYIKYLTSIDGAIYFDTNGSCHGIGVILDGIAQDHIGDASRGARYNSAHRYLEKLKGDGEKCVIAIISEDGVVDLIPELYDEEKILELVHDIIDSLVENDSDVSKRMENESMLAPYKSVDYELYFQIAAAFYKKEDYAKSIEYCEKGVEAAGQHQFVLSEDWNLQGDSYYFLRARNGYEKAIPCYYEAVRNTQEPRKLILYHSNIGHAKYLLAGSLKDKGSEEYKNLAKEALLAFEISFDICSSNGLVANPSMLNGRGLCFDLLATLEKDINRKKEYRQCAVSDYTTALSKSSSNIYYSNRAGSHRAQGMYREALEDFIQAEILKSSRRHLDNIKNILDENKDLWVHAIAFYQQKSADPKSDSPLKQLLDQYPAQMEEENVIDNEAAPTEE